MILDPSLYDPDDPTVYDENTEELAYLAPDRDYPGDLVNFDEPPAF